MTLEISEIFYSLQGESTRMGRPAVFVRLAGCNLRCTYCDTTHAFGKGTKMEITDILDQVAAFGVSDICVTGGEPLIQKEVQDLLEQLVTKKYDVQLETNGSIPLHNMPKSVRIIYDIKCPSSNETESQLWENLDHLQSNDEIKFVLATQEDYQWAADVVRAKGLAKKHEILFSPVPDALNFKSLAEWILKDQLNVRMHIQQHKLIWPKSARGI